MTRTPNMQPDWAAIIVSWNDLARELGLSVALKMTASRKAAYRARSRDFIELGDEWWPRLLDEVRKAKAFAFGENDTGWRINLNYCLSPAGAVKLMEKEWRPKDSPERPRQMSLSEFIEAEGF